MNNGNLTAPASKTLLLRSLLLIVGAILLNLVLGALVREVLRWPIYLDSIGTILAGALLGPLAGAATGALTNLIWGGLVGNQVLIPYAIVAAFVGWAAGYAALLGAFRRFPMAVLAGVLTGVGAALIAAPITTYVFGDITGAGTDYLTAYLGAAGANLLQAATLQSFISDPIDKAISFALVWVLWRYLHPYFRLSSPAGVKRINALGGYSVAVVTSLIATLLCFIFLPAFGRSIVSVFYLAVLISAWRGGLGPALLTTAIGVIAILGLLISPYHNLGITAEDWLNIGIFTVVSLAIAVIADQLEQSKRKLADSLIAERTGQARLRAINDGVDEGLALISADQQILSVNERFVQLFDVPRERITGQSLEDVRTFFDQVFADGNEIYRLILSSASDLLQDESRLVEQIWPQARDLQLFTTPVRDNDGYLGRLFVFRDVTHEREVDRMKTEFVSLVSHELRTPLTSIKGFTELVLDGDAGEINEEVEEYLGIVHSNADRLVALVNDLLDISRIESGRVQLKSEPVSLTEVVDNVAATMQQSIQEKGQHLSIDMDPEAVNVIGDRDKITQVVTNYVSNAYKYTQAGGDIRIDIRKQGDYARVAVIDNGHGIAPADQEQLFTRFYRVDNSMTREVGGTGLGLSIVKQIVELQGGEVGVESALGEGSTFLFTVPLAAAVASAPAADEIAAPKPSPERRGGSVLIVEDEDDIARLIAHHLRKAGYTAAIAHTADDALAALANDLPDLITLDIELPGMQGDELSRRLHNDPLTSDIPILVISVHGDEAGLELGAYALPKPIDQAELVNTVGAMLTAPRQGPVLVIDDDADVRLLLTAELVKQGFEVESAADGESGLALALERHPGLILLDMRLPRMDGFAVLRALKEDEATASIPVIAVTGSSDLKSSARARVLTLGAADFVTKPFDISMLLEEVKVFLGAP
ncbi:MAG: response regulator [Caldilineaceae bacterium]